MASRVPKTTGGASRRAYHRAYAQRRIDKPVLGVPGLKDVPIKIDDYSKLSPYGISGYEGPLVLGKPPRPRKPKF